MLPPIPPALEVLEEIEEIEEIEVEDSWSSLVKSENVSLEVSVVKISRPSIRGTPYSFRGAYESSRKHPIEPVRYPRPYARFRKTPKVIRGLERVERPDIRELCVHWIFARMFFQFNLNLTIPPPRSTTSYIKLCFVYFKYKFFYYIYTIKIILIYLYIYILNYILFNIPIF